MNVPPIARRTDGVRDGFQPTAFTSLHASVVGWFVVRRRERAPHWWKHLVAPVLGAAVTVAVIVEASGTAQLVGAVWLAVGLGVLFAQRGRRGQGGEGGSPDLGADVGADLGADDRPGRRP